MSNLVTRAIGAGWTATWNRLAAEATIQRYLNFSKGGGMALDMDLADNSLASPQQKQAILDVLENDKAAVAKFLNDLLHTPYRFKGVLTSLTARPRILNTIDHSIIENFFNHDDSSRFRCFLEIAKITAIFSETEQAQKINDIAIARIIKEMSQKGGSIISFDILKELQNAGETGIVQAVLEHQVSVMADGLSNAQDTNAVELNGAELEVPKPAHFFWDASHRGIDIFSVTTPEQIRLIGRNLMEAGDHIAFISFAKCIQQHDENLVRHFEVTDVTKAMLSADADLQLSSVSVGDGSNLRAQHKFAMDAITRAEIFKVATDHPEIGHRAVIFLPPALQPPKADHAG